MKGDAVYSETLMRHFLRPSNVGAMKDADAMGRIGDPGCGDYMLCWIKVRDERIEAVSFQCHGCPAAIATGSVMTELARGLALDEVAERITEASIAEALGGMPEQKLHCSNLGAGALQSAILEYRLAEQAEAGSTVFPRLRRQLSLLLDLLGARREVLRVEARPFEEAEAEAHEGDGRLLPVSGRPRLVEASFRGTEGQILADRWFAWEGEAGELCEWELDEAKERASFLAVLNAVAAGAGIARGQRLCRGDRSRYCALEAKFQVMKRHRGPAVMLGWHRHLAGLLADFPASRVVAWDEAIVGQRIGDLEVWGPERRDEALDGATLLWLGDSVLVDGSIDSLLEHPAEKIFWGVGTAAAAAMLGWRRFCPFGT